MTRENLLSIGAMALSCLALLVTLEKNQPSIEKPAVDLGPLNTHINNVESDVETLKNETERKFSTIQYEYSAGYFSPTDSAFRLLKTDYGLLMISLRETEKSGDGYKLIFDIGNPSSITLSGMKGTIAWLPTIDPKTNGQHYLESMNKAKQKDFEILSDIYPGTWNRATISIGPATEETIGTIIMSNLVVNSVKMRTVNIGN